MDDRDPNQFDDLEHRLRQALRPREAPADFCAHLMARIPAASRTDLPGKRQAFWSGAIRWAAAAILLGVVGAGYREHQQRERIAGAHARDQLMLALRVSAATLNDVQRKVARDAKGDAE